jgi:hypothetical protein
LGGARQPSEAASRRLGCLHKLKTIAIGLQTYRETNGYFPPAYVADKDGKPMHSWRVLFLPFMEYDTRYGSYDLNQPWNGPKNKKLAAVRLAEFVCPSAPDGHSPNQTNYVAVVGPNAAWPGEKPRKLEDFGGEVSNTILLIEAANTGIDWAEPRDLSLDDPKLSAMLQAVHPGGASNKDLLFTYYYSPGVHVAMADGRVRVLKTDGLSSEDLRKILQIGGCKEGVFGTRVLFDDCERSLNWPNIAALAVWLLSVGTLLTVAVRSRNDEKGTSRKRRVKPAWRSG